MASKYKRLTLSVILAFVIVAIVLVLGYFYDSNKISYLNANLQNYEQNVNELELATLLTTTNSTFSCNILKGNLYNIASEMQALGRQLTSSDLASSEVNYQQLNDQYTYVRIEYWLLANKINSMCGNDLVTIMFVYPGSGGTQSIVEGDELSFLAYKNDSLVVSAIDGNLNLSVVSILLKSYNISNASLPALIVNDRYVQSGFVNTSQIENIICKYGKCLNFSS
ncbi:hypothetical protein M1558_00520 [Candidatus Parvarchaeota archaeon]|nr:hypothetical protein [Candidatus Parvarchaeota archaeon]